MHNSAQGRNALSQGTLSIHIKKLKELIFIYTYHMLNQKKIIEKLIHPNYHFDFFEIDVGRLTAMSLTECMQQKHLRYVNLAH